jgi:hypothetical protein
MNTQIDELMNAAIGHEEAIVALLDAMESIGLHGETLNTMRSGIRSAADLKRRWEREGYEGQFDMDKMGWMGPRKTFIAEEDINTVDYHMWCEDTNGNKDDYTKRQLAMGSKHGTKKVIYKEWKQDWATAVLAKADSEFDKMIEVMMKNNDVTNKEEMIQKLYRAIRANEFPSDQCYMRSKVINLVEPGKRIVVGSLGFKQNNGKVFWEYG